MLATLLLLVAEPAPAVAKPSAERAVVESTIQLRPDCTDGAAKPTSALICDALRGAATPAGQLQLLRDAIAVVEADKSLSPADRDRVVTEINSVIAGLPVMEAIAR